MDEVNLQFAFYMYLKLVFSEVWKKDI